MDIPSTVSQLEDSVRDDRTRTRMVSHSNKSLVSMNENVFTYTVDIATKIFVLVTLLNVTLTFDNSNVPMAR